MFWDGYDVFEQTKDAQQYIRNQSKNEKPFILFVAFGTPHFPHETAPKEFLDIYDQNNIKLPPNVPASLLENSKMKPKGIMHIAPHLIKALGIFLLQLMMKEYAIIQFLFSHPIMEK